MNWTDLIYDDAAGPEIHSGAVRRELVFRLCVGAAGGTFDAKPAACSSSFVRVFLLLFFFLEVQSLGMRQDFGCDIVRSANQSAAVLARDRTRRRGGRGRGWKERSRRTEIGQEEVAVGVEEEVLGLDVSVQKVRAALVRLIRLSGLRFVAAPYRCAHPLECSHSSASTSSAIHSLTQVSCNPEEET